MRKKRVVFLISLIAVISFAVLTERCWNYFSNSNAAEYNVKRAEKLVDDIFLFVAYVEGDDGVNGPYNCGARWTLQYGVTVKPDGSFVKKNDKPISNAKAKEWSVYHIKKRVIPFFKYFDERKLSDEEIYMTAMFMYNVGGEQVTGYNLKGVKVGKASKYFEAIQAGRSESYCINCMTGFRKSAGRRANGLLKRHWVTGAIGLGIIDVDNVKDLRPCHFYVTKNFGNYYWLDKRRRMIMKNNFYQLRYDDITINAFFNMNEAREGQKSVASILP